MDLVCAPHYLFYLSIQITLSQKGNSVYRCLHVEYMYMYYLHVHVYMVERTNKITGVLINSQL